MPSHRQGDSSQGRNRHRADKAPQKYRTFLVAITATLGVLVLLVLASLAGMYFVIGQTRDTTTASLSYEAQSSLAAAVQAEDLAAQSEEEKSSIAKLQEVTDVVAPEFTTPVNEPENREEIYNVLLLGMDNKSMNDSRTDSMIIVSLNMTRQKIKLISLMRDTLVEVEGHDKNRLNTVNVFLGVDALMETIQKYYGIPLDGYVKVNMVSAAKIIDRIGTVGIWVSAEEAAEVLDREGIELSPDAVNYLNGNEAVQYMRIRHVRDGEYGRTLRQRKVIAQILKQCRSISLTNAMALVPEITPYIKTGFDSNTVLAYAKRVFDLRNAEFSTLRLPMDNTSESGRYNGMYVLNVDFETNGNAAMDFIYGDGALAGDQIKMLNEAQTEE